MKYTFFYLFPGKTLSASTSCWTFFFFNLIVPFTLSLRDHIISSLKYSLYLLIILYEISLAPTSWDYAVSLSTLYDMMTDFSHGWTSPSTIKEFKDQYQANLEDLIYFVRWHLKRYRSEWDVAVAGLDATNKSINNFKKLNTRLKLDLSISNPNSDQKNFQILKSLMEIEQTY